MKILIDKYPMGTIKGQRSPGRYIDQTLYENIDVLAKNIVNDMTFLGIISSSTLEVGTGKSVFVQQLGEAYNECIRRHHKIELPYSEKNLVWKPRDLIERAFKVPKYSFIIIDEWEDAHYWSELGLTLRQFFRKCRQLNLFIIIIIPNFFQLPMSYAISRSVFFIDIKFEGEFQRGFFRFFNFERKAELFIKGKKSNDYNLVKPNFIGRFADGYVFDEEAYRKAKRKDMEEEELGQKKQLNERDIKAKLFKQIYEHFKKKDKTFTIEKLAVAYGITERTGQRYLEGLKDEETSPNIQNPLGELKENDQTAQNINNLIQLDDKSRQEPTEWEDQEPENQLISAKPEQKSQENVENDLIA